jgi:hypothetical protein
MRRLSSSWTSWSRRGGALHRPGCEGPGAEPFPVVPGCDLARPALPRRLFPSGKHRHARASMKSHARRLWISRAPVHERAINGDGRERPLQVEAVHTPAPKRRKDLPRRRGRPVEELVVGLAAVDRSGCRPGPAVRPGCLGNQGNGREQGRERRGTADDERPACRSVEAAARAVEQLATIYRVDDLERALLQDLAKAARKVDWVNSSPASASTVRSVAADNTVTGKAITGQVYLHPPEGSPDQAHLHTPYGGEGKSGQRS